MKKTLIIIPLLCLTVSMVNAQIKIGVKEGLNVASFSYSNDFVEIDVKPIASFHLGGFMQYNFSDHFGMQVDLLYSGQGAIFDFDGLDAKIKLNYLSLPLMLKYHASSGFTAEAGAAFDFLLATKVFFIADDGSSGQVGNIDFSDFFTDTDLKLFLGVGYELPSGLSFNFRFSSGISNISTEDPDSVDYEGEEIYNGLIQLGVGFPLFGN